MAKFIKLPDELKSWKINSALSEGNGGGIYKVSKKDYDGSTINAILLNISVKDDDYDSEHIDFIEDEAAFLQTVSRSGNSFNYIDIVVINKPTKEKIDLYIITEELPTLAQILETKQFSEEEIVDFGIQMSSALETLEAKNIFHGNLTPDNIYVTADGTYKVGGFSDFESKISDFSFVAPEIYKKEEADFTTDIYSLGLIMYYMSNGNKLPFENESNDKKAAIERRMSGDDVSTPTNGSDKLKSVILIACKADNKYRWKNAGNIKNALLSMKDGTVPVRTAVSAIPENTEFDGNVFDEYEYDEFEEPKQEELSEEQPEVSPADETVESVDTEQSIQENADELPSELNETNSTNDDNFDVIEADEDITASNNIAEDKTKSEEVVKDTASTNESVENTVVPAVATVDAIDDENIFDNFESKGKTKLESGFENKDYGSYFDDEDDDIKPITKKSEKNTTEFEEDVNNNKDFEDYYNDFDSEHDDADKGKNKNNKNVIIIVVSIIVILAILGGVGFFAFSGSFGGNNRGNTQSSTQNTVETTNAVTTAVPTTQPTTVAPTTVLPDAEVVPVVGYGYSYAKKLLEEAGFTVEIGEERYSEEYPEGYVIAQSPDGEVTAKVGTVVTLDLSLGLIEPETEVIETEPPTEEPTEAPTQAPVAKTNNSFIFPSSSTAYISKADVEKLDSNELTIAINEIYARNGRIFNDAYLAEYFNSQSWYTPKYSPEEFDKNVKFNQYEQANLQLLISYR
ncbi:MAG: YARHG domain-containing protein [Ruminococcus sp.]|nr:YARHG domain-containing protein [Ruminococcus sp.]